MAPRRNVDCGSGEKAREKPRAIWVMLPAGKATEETVEQLGGLHGIGRHHHRRRQLLLQGRHPSRPKARGEGHPLCRLRHVRRRLGHRARLLHDDRRPEESGGAPRSDLLGPGSRARRHSAHAGPGERRCPRRARLHPRWSFRRRALRQDGPQRHRVRDDAGLCRGLRHPAQQGFEGSARGRALRC